MTASRSAGDSPSTVRLAGFPDWYDEIEIVKNDVESPTGFAWTGVEIDRSRSICR